MIGVSVLVVGGFVLLVALLFRILIGISTVSGGDRQIVMVLSFYDSMAMRAHQMCGDLITMLSGLQDRDGPYVHVNSLESTYARDGAAGTMFYDLAIKDMARADEVARRYLLESSLIRIALMASNSSEKLVQMSNLPKTLVLAHEMLEIYREAATSLISSGEKIIMAFEGVRDAGIEISDTVNVEHVLETLKKSLAMVRAFNEALEIGTVAHQWADGRFPVAA